MKNCKNCNEYSCGAQGTDNVSIICGNSLADFEKKYEELDEEIEKTDW